MAMGTEPDEKNRLADIRLALGRFGDEAFIRILDESGIISHPAFVNIVRRIGRHLRETGARSRAALTPLAGQSTEPWGYVKVSL